MGKNWKCWTAILLVFQIQQPILCKQLCIVNAIKKAWIDKRSLNVPFLSTFNYFRSWPMCRSWGWLGLGRLMYSTCWPETMFWRQRKMNFENIFILPNVIGDRSRRRFGGIFIKIPKVTTARSSSMSNKIGFQMVWWIKTGFSLLPEFVQTLGPKFMTGIQITGCFFNFSPLNFPIPL